MAAKRSAATTTPTAVSAATGSATRSTFRKDRPSTSPPANQLSWLTNMSRREALLWVLFAYVLALVIAMFCMFYLPKLGLFPWIHELSPVGLTLFGDVIATIVVWIFSVIINNSSGYDPYWSVQPPFLALYWWYSAGTIPSTRIYVVLTLVIAWAFRLTYNWGIGWSGVTHEDWRYVDIRGWSGRLYWVISFLGIHLFPTLQVYLGSLPIYAVVTSPTISFGVLDIIATIVTASAIIIEAVADEQLRAFISSPTWRAGTIMESGVWKYSRHPNYFGQVLLWWGILLFGIASGSMTCWYGIGAVTINLMFVFVSVPLLETRSLSRRPAYKQVQQRVSMIVPWFRKENIA